MLYDDILGALADAAEELPRAAMQAALDQWNDVGPRFVSLLQAYVAGIDLSEQTERALFFVVHLLGERCEPAALAPLCGLLADPEIADLVLGEDIDATLPGLLINMSGDDPGPLKALIEDEAAGETVRYDALMALAYLVRVGRIPEAEMRDYLRHLRAHLRPQGESFVWMGWALAVTDLGWEDMADEAEDLCRIGFISRRMMRVSDVRDSLRLTLDDPERMAGFIRDLVGPFGSAIGELEPWYERAADDDLPQAPAVNPLRHIGRNDPCPCGSGRKHKKCCLV